MMPLSLLDEIRKPDSRAMVNCAFGLPMTRLAQCDLTGTIKQTKKYLKYYSSFLITARVSSSYSHIVEFGPGEVINND